MWKNEKFTPTGKKNREINSLFFSGYVQDTTMCEELFSFFHIVLDVLKSQMGPDTIENTIGTFINIFNKDQLTQVIVNEGSAGIRVIEKFLGILQFVVKESDVSFRKFIDSTLNLCLDYIYPLVAEVSHLFFREIISLFTITFFLIFRDLQLISKHPYLQYWETFYYTIGAIFSNLLL